MDEQNRTEQPKTEQKQETGLTVSATVDETGITAQLTSRKQIFCSVSGGTAAEKAILFKAMNNPEKRIADCINQVINAKDVVAEMIEIAHQETGEFEIVPRIVIIDDKGVGYQAVSTGIFSAMKKLIAVYGPPTWQDPIKLKILQISRSKDRKILTFDVV